MIKQTIFASFLSAGLLFTGCHSIQNSLPSTHTALNLAQLENRTWVATQIGNNPIKTSPTARNIPSLQFDAATKRVSGSDGCNRLMGTYTVKKDQLEFGELMGTQMACLEGNNLDAEFNEALSKVTHFQVYNKSLKLLDRYGNPLIHFESAVQPR